MNYLTLGAVSLRVSSKWLAPWGFPRLRVGGLAFLTRSSNGDLGLVSYHPRGSTCWHWAVSLGRADWAPRQPRFAWSARRCCQWHDYLHITRRWAIIVGRQDYHKAP